jgi:hypothetical protein
MGLESAQYISELDATNPPTADLVAQGDDHIRMLKDVLQRVFPNASKAFRFPDNLAKTAAYSILSTDDNKFITGDATAAAFQFTLPALVSANAGWSVLIMKIDSTANAITVAPPSGTINGAASLVISRQFGPMIVWWNGTTYYAINFAVFQLLTESLSALTSPAVDDFLTIYDTSATANLKITLANVLKVINGLDAETAPAIDDLIALYDTSESAVNKMTPENFMKVINLLTELTVPVVGDFLDIYDTSATAPRKVDFKYVNPFSSQLLHVQDQKAAGTEGGTFTSGAWRTRTLNTSVTNEITGASLATNQITLPAGTYFIIAHAPAVSPSASGSFTHKAKLRNVTDASDVLVGTAELQEADSSPSIESQSRSHIMGRFTIAAEKVFEIQHQCSQSSSTTGLGKAAGFSVVEVYTDVMIWKVK